MDGPSHLRARRLRRLNHIHLRLSERRHPNLASHDIPPIRHVLPVQTGVLSVRRSGSQEIHLRRDAVACWLFACTWFVFASFNGFETVLSHTITGLECKETFTACFHLFQRATVALSYPILISFWSGWAIERAFARFRRRKLNGDDDQTRVIVNVYLTSTFALLFLTPFLSVAALNVVMDGGVASASNANRTVN